MLEAITTPYQRYLRKASAPRLSSPRRLAMPVERLARQTARRKVVEHWMIGFLNAMLDLLAGLQGIDDPSTINYQT